MRLRRILLGDVPTTPCASGQSFDLFSNYSLHKIPSKLWQICQALSALLARYAQALRLESDPYDRCLAHREMSGLSGCLSSIFIESLTV